VVEKPLMEAVSLAHAWEVVFIVYFIVAIAVAYGVFRLVRWLRR
jgi:hypothetical protein